jgi:iron-sulfur cluster insertion protein
LVASSDRFQPEIGASDLAVSLAAAEELRRIFSGCEDPEVMAIRLFVAGRGCSGMSYAITFTDRRHEYDYSLQGDGFQVLVDAVAFSYRQGAEVDFERRPGGDTFVFRNVFRATGGSGLCAGCGAADG